MLPLRAVLSATLVSACLLGAAQGFAAPILPTDPWRLCAGAIAGVERQQGIPKHLLSAIALSESGRSNPVTGKRLPWPWTVMAEGQGRYLPTKAAAVAEVRSLQTRGVRNIDVGCMQVNLMHHADAFPSLEHAFDPEVNVTYAARFLRSLFTDQGSWQEAAGRYHSATPELKGPYRDRIVRLWNEQQRLEMASGTAFGDGPLTAGLGGPPTVNGMRVRSPAALLTYAERRANAGLAVRPPAYYRALDGARIAEPPSADRMLAQRDTPSARAPVRSLDEEAAFTLRRIQYLQELRAAMIEAEKSMIRDRMRADATSQPRVATAR